MGIKQIYQKIRIAWYKRLSGNKRVEGNYMIQQPVLCNGRGRILFNGTILGWNPSPGFYDGSCYIEAREADAVIKIGSACINNDFCCIANHGRIEIADGCLIGTNVEIINSDFHSVNLSRRFSGGGKSKDVRIGNNVWIGNNVKIMKGVCVGDGAVIANGAVVFDSVPEKTIVRGNPAVIYKEIID